MKKETILFLIAIILAILGINLIIVAMLVIDYLYAICGVVLCANSIIIFLELNKYET